MNKLKNPILATDSYKLSHINFQKDGVTQIYSNFTPRFNKYFKDLYSDSDDKLVWYGFQGFALGVIFKNSGLSLRSTDLVKKNLFDNYSGVLQLETNYFSVLESIGLDLEKFLTGFDDLEDLLSWVYSSPYFDSKYFKLDNLNHNKRQRLLKNKNSAEILRIFEELPFKESDLVLKKKRIL